MGRRKKTQLILKTEEKVVQRLTEELPFPSYIKALFQGDAVKWVVCGLTPLTSMLWTHVIGGPERSLGFKRFLLVIQRKSERI